MSDDIVTRLQERLDGPVPFDPLGRQDIRDIIDEIERLRAELKDCERDFHSLKVMFDKMRVSRNYWRKCAEQNYVK